MESQNIVPISRAYAGHARIPQPSVDAVTHQQVVQCLRRTRRLYDRAVSEHAETLKAMRLLSAAVEKLEAENALLRSAEPVSLLHATTEFLNELVLENVELERALGRGARLPDHTRQLSERSAALLARAVPLLPSSEVAA